MTREDIQKIVYNSQAFNSYKTASDHQKEEYYFSYNLKCQYIGNKIDTDSLFCYSAQALKIKKELDGCETKYDLHILLVGTTLQPLMLSVSAIKADNILLLYALDGTERKKDNLIDYIKAYNSIEAECEPVNSSEPYTVFSTIKKIIEKEKWQNKSICIDISGGKKSMVGGGFLASSILGIDTYYIDFEKYENGSPVICTEYLNKLENPYEIYNIQLIKQAEELFKYHNYPAAAEMFKKCIEKISHEKAINYSLLSEKEKIEKKYLTSRCYMYWDRYDYDEADKYSKHLNEEQKKHLNNLKIYSSLSDKKTRFDSEYFYDYIIDRVLSAFRRSFCIEDGDYSGYYDAILRYYQCVEMLLECYIYKNEKNKNYDPDNDKLRVVDIRSICFEGLFNDKKNNKVYEIEKIKDKALKGKIKELNNWRDEFVHVKKEKQKSNIVEGKKVVKELLCQFYKEDIIERDLERYTF